MNRLSLLAGAALALGSITAAAADEIDLPTRNGKLVLNICTGGAGGGYFRTGKTFSVAVRRHFWLTVKETAGSIENVEGMLAFGPDNAADACHFAIIQDDSITMAKAEYASFAGSHKVIRRLYPEVAQLIVRENSDFESLDDFRGNTGTIGVVSGSGAYVTMKAMGVLESDYLTSDRGDDKANIVLDSSYYDWHEALDALGDGMIQGVLYVGSFGRSNGFMSNSVSNNTAFDFTLADIDDGDLDDDGTYTIVQLDDDAYSMTDGSDTDTIVTWATLVVHPAVETRFKSLGQWRAIRRSLSEAANQVIVKARKGSLIEW